MSLLSGFQSLARGINTVKRDRDEVEEGTQAPLQEEVVLDLPDEQLLESKNKWEKKWSEYEPEVKRKQDECEKYWLAQQFSVAEANAGRPMVDNALFESLETFLPQATKRNPDPMVSADDSQEGTELAQKVQKMLVYHADRLRFKLKLKKLTRFWAIYFLGVIKVGWSVKENDVTISVIRPTKLILDPEATIEEGEYTGEYIGEIKRESASVLMTRFPSKEDIIRNITDGKLGTMIQYTEWWTDKVVFWTMRNEVLGKAKNPHWNEESIQTMTDEFGGSQEMVTPAKNHFANPKKPYVFLSIFNLGKHPHDDTSLLHQNLANQDIINKRNRQIDKNADDNANGSTAFSGDFFTQEQAARAQEAKRKGMGVWVPSGDVRSAIQVLQPYQLPAFVYNDLADKRDRVQDIFGTRGSSASGLTTEKTVRGKIVNRASDESRIGGGISEFLEQVADGVYNWLVQIMYVNYDEEHYGSVLGMAEGANVIALSNQEFNQKLTVSVKEGSLVPKDDVSRGNQAVDLAASGKMSLVDLYNSLDYSNPQEMATRAWLEINAPEMLYGKDPRVLQAIQMQQQQQVQEEQVKQQGNEQQQQTKQEGAMNQIAAKGQQQRSTSIASQLLKQVPLP